MARAKAPVPDAVPAPPPKPVVPAPLEAIRITATNHADVRAFLTAGASAGRVVVIDPGDLLVKDEKGRVMVYTPKGGPA
jgi:hypothetical protein